MCQLPPASRTARRSPLGACSRHRIMFDTPKSGGKTAAFHARRPTGNTAAADARQLSPKCRISRAHGVPEGFYERIKQAVRQRIARRLRSFDRVVDPGCGSCVLDRLLAQRNGQSLIGIDISDASFPGGQTATASRRWEASTWITWAECPRPSCGSTSEAYSAGARQDGSHWARATPSPATLPCGTTWT